MPKFKIHASQNLAVDFEITAANESGARDHNLFIAYVEGRFRTDRAQDGSLPRGLETSWPTGVTVEQGIHSHLPQKRIHRGTL
jgi:hypothetical protein